MAGDKIVKINHIDAFGKQVSNQYVLDRLRGPKGSKVDVSIYRKGRKELWEYSITRDKIPINSIDASYMLTDNIGYVKLCVLQPFSADEFIDAVNGLKK